jgi:hypothetical protein
MNNMWSTVWDESRLKEFWAFIFGSKQFAFLVQLPPQECLVRLHNLERPRMGFFNPSSRTVKITHEPNAARFEICIERYNRGWAYNSVIANGVVSPAREHPESSIISGSVYIGILLFLLLIFAFGLMMLISALTRDTWFTFLILAVGIYYVVRYYLDYQQLYELMHETFAQADVAKLESRKMTSRKSHSVIKHRTLNALQFEFSTDCPYSACVNRLKALDAKLKLEHEVLQERTRSTVSTPPRIEIHDMGETASFEWYFNGSLLVEGTLQSVTAENTRFTGTTYYQNKYGATLILLVIVLAVVLLPFLSAYVQPASASHMTAAVDMRCTLALFAIPIGFAILMVVGFFFQLDSSINRLMAAVTD